MEPCSDERPRIAPMPLRLSASAVRDFLSCRYRYAASHVMQPSPGELRQVTHLRFGEAVHQALAGFIVRGGWDQLDLHDLIGLLDARWPATVYPDFETASANRDRALAMLTSFYESRYPHDVAYELGVERRLTWRRFHRGILATGKVDRAVILEDGTLEVLDYKTGRRCLSRSELARDTGALFYRSLAADAFAELAPQAIRITYFNLTRGLPVGVTFGRETFLAGWRHILGTADEIRAAMQAVVGGVPVLTAFPPSRGVQCALCPLSAHCDRLAASGAIAPAPQHG